MSKIINDGFTLSGTGCFIAVPISQQWASKVNFADVVSLKCHVEETGEL